MRPMGSSASGVSLDSSMLWHLVGVDEKAEAIPNGSHYCYYACWMQSKNQTTYQVFF
jgi:hypothetical protein